MWFGLVYLYLDSYLVESSRTALMFLLAQVLAIPATPLWLLLVRRTSKATVWATGVLLFVAQLMCLGFLHPHASWWWPFLCVLGAHLYFGAHDIAACSSLGDIVDYGRLKFHKDRGATYFGLNTLVFKVALGFGGAASLVTAGMFGFNPAENMHTNRAVFGMKVGLVVVPACLALLGLFFIARLPIDSRRHAIIKRRLESRMR
jgi:Na+/melibiose symporter-like transporter